MKKSYLLVVLTILLSISFVIQDSALGQPPRRGRRPDGARRMENRGAATASEKVERTPKAENAEGAVERTDVEARLVLIPAREDFVLSAT